MDAHIRDVYGQIYDKLQKLGILTVKEHVRAKSGSFMDLVVEKVGENEFSLTHYYEQNGDLIPDPDVTVRVHENMKMAEALTYQDSFGYQAIYIEDEDGTKLVDAVVKQKLNGFLNYWLSNLMQQGFKVQEEAEVSCPSS